MSRVPPCLDNLLTAVGEVVSLTRQQRFIPRKIFWYSFLSETNPRAIVWLEGLGKLKKKSITSSGLDHATFQLVA
jgi:hypothetical protein